MTSTATQRPRLTPRNFFLLVTALGLIARFLGTPLISADMKWFLLPWFEQMYPSGIASLSEQVGNYGLLYQTLIAALTYIPLPAVFLYKTVSIIFDVLLALSAAHIAARITGTSRTDQPARVAYLALMLLPPFVINSGWWGQCDSMYSLAALWTLVFLYEKRYAASGLSLGLAFALKLQTIFIMPFIVAVYVLRRRFPIPGGNLRSRDILGERNSCLFLWSFPVGAIVDLCGTNWRFSTYGGQRTKFLVLLPGSFRYSPSTSDPRLRHDPRRRFLRNHLEESSSRYLDELSRSKCVDGLDMLLFSSGDARKIFLPFAGHPHPARGECAQFLAFPDD